MPNPNDLNQLDENKPDGAAIPVSQLDDYQREHRRFMKGWAVIEHGLAGRHAFPRGTTAQRPINPVTGSLFINTDAGVGPEIWDGAAWVSIIPGGLSGLAIPTGIITSYGGSPAPVGWVLCDGAEISRTTFANLFATVGIAYGAGDGSTTFKIPDLRGRFPAGLDGTVDFTTLGLAGGALSRSPAFTGTLVPDHRHEVPAPNVATESSEGIDTGVIVNDAAFPISGIFRLFRQMGAFTGTASASLRTVLSGLAGAFTPQGTIDSFKIIPPYLTINYIIKT